MCEGLQGLVLCFGKDIKTPVKADLNHCDMNKNSDNEFYTIGYDVTTLARMGTEQVQYRKIFLQRSDPQSSEEMANTWKFDNRCSA